MIPRSIRARCSRAAIALLAAALSLTAPGVRAEASAVRISYGFGILYLPLMVMDREHLLEKHAKAAGLPDVKVEWKTFDGGNVINDAMLSGALDIAGIGVPGFLTLWAKAKDNPQLEVRGLTGMSSSSMYLMTRNPRRQVARGFHRQGSHRGARHQDVAARRAAAHGGGARVR